MCLELWKSSKRIGTDPMARKLVNNRLMQTISVEILYVVLSY